jgi:hypothetical protein
VSPCSVISREFPENLSTSPPPRASSVTPGCDPQQKTTTVRVEEDRVVKTEGPLAGTKQTLRALYLIENDDPESVLEFASGSQLPAWDAPSRYGQSRRGNVIAPEPHARRGRPATHRRGRPNRLRDPVASEGVEVAGSTTGTQRRRSLGVLDEQTRSERVSGRCVRSGRPCM